VFDRRNGGGRDHMLLPTDDLPKVVRLARSRGAGLYSAFHRTCFGHRRFGGPDPVVLGGRLRLRRPGTRHKQSSVIVRAPSESTVRPLLGLGRIQVGRTTGGLLVGGYSTNRTVRTLTLGLCPNSKQPSAVLLAHVRTASGKPASRYGGTVDGPRLSTDHAVRKTQRKGLTI
jgi:hypothetical protein